MEGIARDITERKRTEAEREALLESARLARDEAERRLQESVKLAEVYRGLARSLELGEVTATVCRAVRELVGADGAAFIVREGDEVHYTDIDSIAPLWKGQRFPVKACVSGWSIVERQPAVIEDVVRRQPRSRRGLPSDLRQKHPHDARARRQSRRGHRRLLGRAVPRER